MGVSIALNSSTYRPKAKVVNYGYNWDENTKALPSKLVLKGQ